MMLNNQIAVVSGGGSGLGQACAELLSRKGCKVVIWDKSIDHLNDKDVVAFTCDVSSEQDVDRVMDVTLSQIGAPTIAINCAGIAPAKRMVGKEGAMPLSAFKQVIDINLVGTFNVMRVVANAMINHYPNLPNQTRGIIINTASIAAYEGQIGQTAYSASKGGVVAMTLPAARELAQHGIRVNTIAPGLFATPLLLNMPKEVQDSLASTVTYPKRLGEPGEFASLVLHLIENDYINGEVIRLDGALRMQAK